MPFEMQPRNNTPISVPQIRPLPPKSEVPPMMTAAITSSSMPVAVVPVPDPICEAISVPRDRGQRAEDAEAHRLHPPDVDARQARRLHVAADGIDGAAEAGEIHQEMHARRRSARRCRPGNGMPKR